jgi:hypothetical protein
MQPAQKTSEQGRRSAKKRRKKRQRRIPLPSDKTLAYSIPYAGGLIGLSRQSSYNAAKNNKIPTVEVNGRKLVPRAAFERMFGAVVGTAQPDK